MWNLYHKNNKTTLLQKLDSYSTVSDNVLEDVSMAHLDIGGNFVSGNIDISVKSNSKGSRCIHVSSVGHEDHQIPMIKNITSTKVPAAWKRKVKPKRTVLDKCEDIIDVLSLIPPEYLQDEVEYDDENDLDSGGVDNDTMEVDNEEEGNVMHETIAHGSGIPGSVTPAAAASMPVTHQNIMGRQVTPSTMAGTCQNGTPENGSPENVAASDGTSRNVRHHNIS